MAQREAMETLSDNETLLGGSISTTPTLVNSHLATDGVTPPTLEPHSPRQQSTDLLEYGSFVNNTRDPTLHEDWQFRTLGLPMAVPDRFARRGAAGQTQLPADFEHAPFLHGQALTEDPLTSRDPWLPQNLVWPLANGEADDFSQLQNVASSGDDVSAPNSIVAQSGIGTTPRSSASQMAYPGQTPQPGFVTESTLHELEVEQGGHNPHAPHGDPTGSVLDAEPLIGNIRGSISWQAHVLRTLRCGFCGRAFSGCARWQNHEPQVYQHVRDALLGEKLEMRNWRFKGMPAFLYVFEAGRHIWSTSEVLPPDQGIELPV